MKVTAIIVAAGSGLRMGLDKPKQFLDLMGKPVLAHTLMPFEALADVDEVILTIPAGWEAFCHSQILEKYQFKKVRKVIEGGKERKDSVFAALKASSPEADIVLVHDGARPLIEKKYIQACIQAARDQGAAIVAIPLRDTPKQVNADHFVTQTLNRQVLWQAQTPQGFRRDILWKAFESAAEAGFYGTDDATLVERLGLPVQVVSGSTWNMKLTNPEDLRLAELFLQSKQDD